MTDTREALAAWDLAYAAFTGAFDTPQMRRQMPDEYSEDARKRMRDFDEIIRAALAQRRRLRRHQQPAQATLADRIRAHSGSGKCKVRFRL